MQVLLLGEYSNVHATLAQGLKKYGVTTTVASNGDFWKDYPRDIDLSRRGGMAGKLLFAAKLAHALPRMKGYDIVQIINPMFLELKAKRIWPIYQFLRQHNRKIIMGAFGMDYYWVHENITRKPLRYSDFNIGQQLREDADALKERKDWIGTDKEKLNKYVAADCDGIVAGLYEYWAVYSPLFTQKTHFIPFPIRCKMSENDIDGTVRRPVKFFIGISKNRSSYKGTDIMLAAAQAVMQRYPHSMTLQIAEGVPFGQYVEMMNNSDVILDQLYSYTPGMNALEAMARGIVCIGGGEPENYDLLNEERLRPIVNVAPNYESVYHAIEQLAAHPERVPELKRQSIAFVRKHHEYTHVAHKYLELYNTLL